MTVQKYVEYLSMLPKDAQVVFQVDDAVEPIEDAPRQPDNEEMEGGSPFLAALRGAGVEGDSIVIVGEWHWGNG